MEHNYDSLNKLDKSVGLQIKINNYQATIPLTVTDIRFSLRPY